MQRLDLKCTIARLECMYTLKDIIPRSTNVAKSISFSLSLSLSRSLDQARGDRQRRPFFLARFLSVSFFRQGCGQRLPSARARQRPRMLRGEWKAYVHATPLSVSLSRSLSLSSLSLTSSTGHWGRFKSPGL